MIVLLFFSSFFFLPQLMLIYYSRYCVRIYFKNTKKPVYSYSTNPDRQFSSSTSQHFKMFPPFASSEGYSASGVRYQSDGVRDTHPLPHSESTRIRERMCDLTLTLSHSPFAYYSYISSYSLLIIPSTVL